MCPPSTGRLALCVGKTHQVSVVPKKAGHYPHNRKMESSPNEAIFRALAFKDWTNHCPTQMGRKSAPPTMMIMDLIEAIRSSNITRPLITVFAFSPTAYSGLSNLPGVYVYGLTRHEKDLALMNILEAAMDDGLCSVCIFVGASAGDVQSLFDRGGDQDMVALTIEAVHEGSVSTAGGMGLHLSRCTPASILKDASHALLSGEVGHSNNPGNKAMHRYLTIILSRKQEDTGNCRYGPKECVIRCHIPRKLLTQGTVSKQATATFYSEAEGLQKAITSGFQCQEERHGQRTLLSANDVGRTTHHRFQDEGDGRQKNEILEMVQQALLNNKVQKGRRGYFFCLCGRPVSKLHSRLRRTRTGREDGHHTGCMQRQIHPLEGVGLQHCTSNRITH